MGSSSPHRKSSSLPAIRCSALGYAILGPNASSITGFLAAWAAPVQWVDAHSTGIWELPVLSPLTPRGALLIRPDGYVAWVGDGADQGLQDMLTTWFGPCSRDGT
ncbi:MAG: hypothetical protein ABIQ16_09170 [Polyangiaceae bacterium]